MKIKLHYNQFSNGGAVDHEKWSLIPSEEMQYNPFRQCETLKTIEIEIPDTWEIDKDRDMIFEETGNSIYYQEMSKNQNEIKVATNNYPYCKTIWREKTK